MGSWRDNANYCRSNSTRSRLRCHRLRLNEKGQAREEQYDEDDASERYLVDAAEHQDAEHRSGYQRRQADREINQDF